MIIDFKTISNLCFTKFVVSEFFSKGYFSSFLLVCK